MSGGYVRPTHGAGGFHCPHCGVYADQEWQDLTWKVWRDRVALEDNGISKCSHCGEVSLWMDGGLIYPQQAPVPQPAEDMPADVESLYDEARDVFPHSPRSAAGLLRVAVERLLEDLGETDGTLNQRIGNLVEQGMPQRIQKAMDVVRVTGNDAVHPGEIDFEDDPETAQQLFMLLNQMVETMITQPGEIDNLFEGLPERKREGIRKRDGSDGE